MWRTPFESKSPSSKLSFAMSIAQEMKRAQAAADASRPAPAKEYPRVTSPRGYWLRQKLYDKLVNEDLPENVRKIKYAKGFGDLSENAEYQYAKDEQRALLQRQSAMLAELEQVRTTTFSDATTDEVMPGVTVVVAAKGGEKTYTVLGEWDNDLELGIISQRTQVAKNMLGKKVGETFDLPDGDGNLTSAEIREIRLPGAEIVNWMKLPEDA